ncbi:peptidase inhibitor family I36 protein [Streptomyces sp. NPDC047017]|uniref:peptidase inhibitor family I36 protein n=1 Tax=Streptomyces sp. NPDC047017 TaxID=3155024 RepID=UPI00341069EA
MAVATSALTLAATGVLAGTATAAPASAQAQTCVAGYYCVWTLDSYEGTRYAYKDSNPSWRNYGSWHNDQSSWNSGTSGMGVQLIGDGGRVLGCLPQNHGWWHHNPANKGEGNKWTWAC